MAVRRGLSCFHVCRYPSRTVTMCIYISERFVHNRSKQGTQRKSCWETGFPCLGWTENKVSRCLSKEHGFDYSWSHISGLYWFGFPLTPNRYHKQAGYTYKDPRAAQRVRMSDAFPCINKYITSSYIVTLVESTLVITILPLIFHGFRCHRSVKRMHGQASEISR